MKLVFSDEFNYEGKPDPSKWGYEMGGHGWGNNELQYYTDSAENAYVKDGKLFIVAKRQEHGGREYTSARLVTHNKFSFKYGRIDVSAKLPKGAGSWPAIWMLPDSIKSGKPWPLCGEIDVMEHVGKDEDMVHVSLHSEAYNHVKGTQVTHFERLENVTGGFHTYSCQWDEDAITFYFDNRQVARFEKNVPGRDSSETGWPFDQEFFILLNVAMGGWGGEVDEAALPFVMEVEYVRVYQ